MLKKLNDEDKKKLTMLAVLGVLCIGGLVIIPSENDNKGDEEVVKTNTSQTDKTSEGESLEVRLENILAQINGAGEVDVMITFDASEEIQPAFNSNSTTEQTEEKDSQGGERTTTTSSENKTMITSGSSDPIVIKTTEPKIKGVIVVSSGASDAQVKEKLYSAVQTSLQIQGHQVEIYSK